MSDAPTHTGVRAVFLSYAREDAEVARRIAEALRGFGIEVWFDMNELRGGDAWDSKIRGQIKSCALFMPLVSQRTEERTEGYFRREWKLAVDRTHDMAGGRTFIVPVVIDDTPEAEAAVPEEFMRYQWTSLPGGEPTPEFVAQVKRLLEALKKPTLKVEHPKPPTLPPHLREAARIQAEEEAAARSAKRTGLPKWTWGALVAVIIGVAVALGLFRKSPPPAPAPAEPKPAPAAAPAEKPADKSIAVIPFTNMSEEKDSAFFTDGIHEDILTNLALIRELRVVSRTSVMQYRATTKPMKQIAQELGVTYILEGSVRRAGNKVRVTGQLIHAATDEHVWARSYDRDLTDVFAIQAELSSQIAGALKAALSPEEKALLARKPTENPAAYDLFLRSRDVNNREGVSDAARRRRIGLLQQAVELDPAFAQAWGELASACAFAYFGNLEGSEAYLVQAQAAIDRAVKLAPDDPEVIGSVGTFYYYGHRDYVRATEQYEKLARLQPNSPVVFNSLALIQRRQGRWVESLANSRRACELDPANLSYLRALRSTLEYARRWPEAIATQRRIVALSPDSGWEEYLLARYSFLATGSRREVEALFAGLPPAYANSPDAIFIKTDWANFIGDLAEHIRLDRLQPYFDNNGTPRADQAVLAALSLWHSGDRTAAQARLEDYPAVLRAQLAAGSMNNRVRLNLALIELIQGRPAETIRLAEEAVAALPESRDAVDGPRLATERAFLYDLTGNPERALAEFQRLVRLPSGLSIEFLKANQAFLSSTLRQDPRFQALLNDPANNAPLF